MKRAIAILLVLLCLSCTVYADGCGFIEIQGIGRYDLSYSVNQANRHQHIAMLYRTYGVQTIGNHYGSASESGGQWKLENVKLGDRAHLEWQTADGTQVINHAEDYVCYAVFLADAVDMKFYHAEQEVKPYAETDLICCTCVGHDSTRNYVALFERVS